MAFVIYFTLISFIFKQGRKLSVKSKMQGGNLGIDRMVKSGLSKPERNLLHLLKQCRCSLLKKVFLDRKWSWKVHNHMQKMTKA